MNFIGYIFTAGKINDIAQKFVANIFIRTRRYTSTLDKVERVVDARSGEIIFGLNIMVNRNSCVLKTRKSKREKKRQSEIQRKRKDERIKIFEVNIFV